MGRRHVGAGLLQRYGLSSYGPPGLVSLDVSSGTEVGGTAIVLTGRLFVPGATTVTVGGVAATVGATTTTTCAITTPANASALSSTAATNARDVVVTTPYGTTTMTGAFTYTSELKRIAGALYCAEFRAGDPAITIATGVSNWPDYNGNGALAQATGANQPTFSATSFNGGPGVTGDGSNDTLRATLTTAVANGARPYIMIAGSAPSGVNGTYFAGLSHAGSGGGASFLAFGFGGGKFTSDRKDTVSATTTSGAATDTNRHLFECGMTASGTNELVIDGTGYNSTNGGTAADTLAVFDLFSIYGSFNGSFRAAVVLILNDAPTAQNLTDLRAAFKASTWVGYTGSSLGLP